jgi:hypothetical protein
MGLNKLIRLSIWADYAHEQYDPGIRLCASPVMLSLVLSAANGTAKHLAAPAPDLRCAQGDRVGADHALSQIKMDYGWRRCMIDPYRFSDVHIKR